jgi:transposase
VTAEARIPILEAENAALRQQVKMLEEKNLLLLQQLEKKPVKKDSHNSHNPPSEDKAKPKRTKSLRKKSGRKPGGQVGHPGQTLEQTEQPDEQHDLKSDFCGACGSALPEDGQKLISKRQVIEIPPIEPIYIEYLQFGCICPNCFHHQKADYPDGVNAPIQYGASVMAWISYFNVFQYIPFRRLKILFADLFNVPLSEGSIQNVLNRAAAKARPVYDTIREKIKSATQVGSDETGAKVNGVKWWIWVWQNVLNTFLKASNNRGSQTIEETFPDGLPNATVGSDRWAAQLKTATKNKQLCLPHLQRDLVWLEEKEQSAWATYFKKLLHDALDLRKLAEQRGLPFRRGESAQTYKLEHRLNRLLARCIVKEQFPETVTFQNSMIKNRNYIFPFLYDLEVPPDNNASERAIRNVKVKQKISGQFKSGQHAFCILRSVIDTLRKRNLDVFTYLSKIMATPVPE